jgi:hypothetical protein
LGFERNMKSQDNWPFDQEPNTATFTTTHVLKENMDITHVYHDADDGGWQFHYSGATKTSDAMIVALSEIVAHDPSVKEVADLPLGWMATRDCRGKPWKRMKN